jgi:hypothetical protein
MTPKTPQAALPTLPNNVPPPPVFGSAPTGKKPGVKSPTASFLGASALPSPGNLGGKQLIGN